MKKQLALILSIVCCSQSSMHALSWSTTAKIIFSPVYVPFYCIKKSLPPLARFCAKYPEDALLLGVIAAAVCMAAKEKYKQVYPQGILHILQQQAQASASTPATAVSQPAVSQVPSQIADHSVSSPSSSSSNENDWYGASSSQSGITNHQVKSKKPKRKVYPNLTQQEVKNLLDDHAAQYAVCSICLEGFDAKCVTTECNHTFHKKCLANTFDYQGKIHTIDHLLGHCPDDTTQNKKCYKKPYSCPNCRQKYCILKS